jgi:hypothetical protein
MTERVFLPSIKTVFFKDVVLDFLPIVDCVDHATGQKILQKILDSRVIFENALNRFQSPIK